MPYLDLVASAFASASVPASHGSGLQLIITNKKKSTAKSTKCTLYMGSVVVTYKLRCSSLMA